MKKVTITLNDDGIYPSISAHKYHISEDSDSLLIYYKDEVNYDVYLGEKWTNQKKKDQD